MSTRLNLKFLNCNRVRKNSAINPLSANVELSRHENLSFLWTWILRWVPRSFATHASLCNTLSSNKLCPKTVKILALKRVKAAYENQSVLENGLIESFSQLHT